MIVWFVTYFLKIMLVKLIEPERGSTSPLVERSLGVSVSETTPTNVLLETLTLYLV